MRNLILLLTCFILVSCGGEESGDKSSADNFVTQPTPSQPAEPPEKNEPYTGKGKYLEGFASPNIIIQDHIIDVTMYPNHHDVVLGKQNASNTIFYRVVTGNPNDLDYQEYFDQKLSVNNHQALFYKECSPSDDCSDIKKVFFYENEYYLDHAREFVDDNFDSMKETMHNLSEAKKAYEKTSLNKRS